MKYKVLKDCYINQVFHKAGDEVEMPALAAKYSLLTGALIEASVDNIVKKKTYKKADK